MAVVFAVNSRPLQGRVAPIASICAMVSARFAPVTDTLRIIFHDALDTFDLFERPMPATSRLATGRCCCGGFGTTDRRRIARAVLRTSFEARDSVTW